MKVKICGITSAEDIKIVNACKPDFAGFVMFFPKSKRNISPETAKSLIETLNKNVLSVAVTVSPTLEQVKTAYDCGFDYILYSSNFSRSLTLKARITFKYGFESTSPPTSP